MPPVRVALFGSNAYKVLRFFCGLSERSSTDMFGHLLAADALPYNFTGLGVLLLIGEAMILVFGIFATLFGRTRLPGILMGGTAFAMSVLVLMLCGNAASDEGPKFTPIVLISLTLLGVACGPLLHAIAIRSR